MIQKIHFFKPLNPDDPEDPFAPLNPDDPSLLDPDDPEVSNSKLPVLKNSTTQALLAGPDPLR
jgi:hypothetical protein